MGFVGVLRCLDLDVSKVLAHNVQGELDITSSLRFWLHVIFSSLRLRIHGIVIGSLRVLIQIISSV